MVTIPSPRPIRAVQRARLWAMTCTASQAPLAANLPDGEIDFPGELLDVVGIVRMDRVDELEPDRLACFGVGGLPDDPHAALPEALVEGEAFRH